MAVMNLSAWFLKRLVSGSGLTLDLDPFADSGMEQMHEPERSEGEESGEAVLFGFGRRIGTD